MLTYVLQQRRWQSGWCFGLCGNANLVDVANEEEEEEEEEEEDEEDEEELAALRSDPGGSVTPRSLETPLIGQGGSKLIRDPYAPRSSCMHPRHQHGHHESLRKTEEKEDIFTILIRLPNPVVRDTSMRKRSNIGHQGSEESNITAPSIRMMPDMSRSAQTALASATSTTTKATTTRLPPLNARVVPRRLVHNASLESRASSGRMTTTLNTQPRSRLRSKSKTSEKKQERKAAKTLSAILLAFIVTWTPYSVLVVLNALLGKESADRFIPEYVWQFSYYLCYINSTVNPVLYALCNEAFRRTYLRIITCRWTTRQNGNRHFVNNRYF